MKKYSFFIRGRKDDRVYTSDGRKVFFPDRHNRKDLTIGIAECSISNELDKYGFVLGSMVKNVGTLRDALDAGKVDLNRVICLKSLKGYEYWIEKRENDERFYCAFINGEVFDFISEDDFTLPDKQRSNLNNFYYSLRCQSDDCNDALTKIRVEYVDSIVSNLKKPERQLLIESIIREITRRFPKSIKLYDKKLVLIESLYGYQQFYYYNNDKNNLDTLPDCNVEGMTVEDLTDEIKSIILDYNLVVRPKEDDNKLVYKQFKCFNENIEVCFMPTGYFSYDSHKEVKDTLDKSHQDFADFKKRVGKYVTRNNISELHKLSTKDYQLGLIY